MAPRRTAAKTAVNEAKDFDFDSFLAGFRRPEFRRSLFQRADLAPQIHELESILDDIDLRIDKLEKTQGNDEDQGITDVNPLVELERRREEITLEYNDLANEFNASAVSFTFRIPDDKDDKDHIDSLMERDGYNNPPRPDTEGLDEDAAAALNAEFDKAFAQWWDALMVRSMSVTCVSHELTVEQWEALRARVGLVAFNSLSEAWAEAVQAAKPTVPFSLRPSISVLEPSED